MSAELVEEIDGELAHDLLLVEQPEAQWLQAVEVRWEPRQQLWIV